jgi:hypothetical protein
MANIYPKYFFLLTILFVSQLSFAQTKDAKSRKKHKNIDTVGIVNGGVITYYDFKQALAGIIRIHKAEIKKDSIGDTAFSRFVNLAWDKLVRDMIIDQELQKRKLTMTSEKTIEKLLKNPTKEIQDAFTDSATKQFDSKALKAYLQNPNPDLERTKILDYYQTLFEQERLAAALSPKAKTETERIEKLDEWLKKKIEHAYIEDRRSSFGFY